MAVREEERLDGAVEEGGAGERRDVFVLGSEFVGVVCLLALVLDAGDGGSGTFSPFPLPLPVVLPPSLASDDDEPDDLERVRIL
jgi:hypothetical protein